MYTQYATQHQAQLKTFPKALRYNQIIVIYKDCSRSNASSCTLQAVGIHAASFTQADNSVSAETEIITSSETRRFSNKTSGNVIFFRLWHSLDKTAISWQSLTFLRAICLENLTDSLFLYKILYISVEFEPFVSDTSFTPLDPLKLLLDMVTNRQILGD